MTRPQFYIRQEILRRICLNNFRCAGMEFMFNNECHHNKWRSQKTYALHISLHVFSVTLSSIMTRCTSN